jgi:hypothetical protein
MERLGDMPKPLPLGYPVTLLRYVDAVLVAAAYLKVLIVTAAGPDAAKVSR